jgi:predicted nucleic acid-binding protein
VLWFDERSHTEAWRLYTSNRGEGMNFVDCSVAVAAREMGSPIFTFDSDFANYGLTVVP